MPGAARRGFYVSLMRVRPLVHAAFTRSLWQRLLFRIDSECLDPLLLVVLITGTSRRRPCHVRQSSLRHRARRRHAARRPRRQGEGRSAIRRPCPFDAPSPVPRAGCGSWRDHPLQGLPMAMTALRLWQALPSMIHRPGLSARAGATRKSRTMSTLAWLLASCRWGEWRRREARPEDRCWHAAFAGMVEGPTPFDRDPFLALAWTGSLRGPRSSSASRGDLGIYGALTRRRPNPSRKFSPTSSPHRGR